jgi:hypothetical protein
LQSGTVIILEIDFLVLEYLLNLIKNLRKFDIAMHVATVLACV